MHANSYPHRSTREGVGVLMGPLAVFDMLQYFETILPKWRAFDQDEVYLISASATRGL